MHVMTSWLFTFLRNPHHPNPLPSTHPYSRGGFPLLTNPTQSKSQPRYQLLVRTISSSRIGVVVGLRRNSPDHLDGQRVSGAAEDEWPCGTPPPPANELAVSGSGQTIHSIQITPIGADQIVRIVRTIPSVVAPSICCSQAQ